jgi:hypothetical protein
MRLEARSAWITMLAVGLTMVRPLAAERQVTRAEQGHLLTNIGVWSPDGEWIVYDTRTRDDQFTSTSIERVQVRTGDVQVLYTARNESRVGVATTDPVHARVVFIHGPERPTADWSYGATRRSGVIVDPRLPGEARPLDAMAYAPPFVAGALRGGSHVHVFSPDGAWVSFTYEDEVLARLGTDSSFAHDLNQRNVGVAVPAGPVRVGQQHPRNHDGEWFSVVVTRTVNQPRPGSDDISRAAEEGWVGVNGYVRPDGTRQRRALAFQGTVTASDGRSHPEVFIVDLPDDLTQPGDGPLEGSATRRPAPPRGVAQRRLTFTEGRVHRGLATEPRHWLRASPDGSQIAFLMADEAGVVQLWTVSPGGGSPRQLTQNAHGLSSAFSWSSDGTRIAHVMDRSVCLTMVESGRTIRLTSRSAEPADAPHRFACIFAPDDRLVAYTRSVARATGRYDQVFVVTVPDAAAPGPE